MELRYALGMRLKRPTCGPFAALATCRPGLVGLDAGDAWSCLAPSIWHRKYAKLSYAAKCHSQVPFAPGGAFDHQRASFIRVCQSALLISALFNCLCVFTLRRSSIAVVLILKRIRWMSIVRTWEIAAYGKTND